MCHAEVPGLGPGEPGLARGLVRMCFSGCSRSRCGHCHPVRHTGWLGLRSGAGGDPGGIPGDHGGPGTFPWSCTGLKSAAVTHSRDAAPGAVWSQPLLGGCGWWRPLAPSPSREWEGFRGPCRSGGKAGGVSSKIPRKSHRSGAAGDEEDRHRQRPHLKNGHKMPVSPEDRDTGVAGRAGGQGQARSRLGLALGLAAGAPLVGRDGGRGSCPAPRAWSLLTHRCAGSAPGPSPPNVHSLTPPPFPPTLQRPHLSVPSLLSVSVSLFPFCLPVYFVL